MTNIPILNEEALTKRFGGWPSFHDAEIIRARFERQGDDAPFLECEIHVFEMTDEVDSKGFYVLKNHTLVTMRFCDIGLESFRWWNQQNVISDMIIEPSEPNEEPYSGDWPIQVEIGSSYGCETRFKCRVVKVVCATDFKRETS